MSLNYEDLDEIFTYHAPFGNQTERYGAIRGDAQSFVGMLLAFCPDSAERTLAIRSVQQAVMWANASIAIHEAPKVVKLVENGA